MKAPESLIQPPASERGRGGPDDAVPAEPVTWDQLHAIGDEVRVLARHLLALEGSAQSMQSMDLVQTAFRRLAPADLDWDKVTWASRAHFFGAARKAMQRALIDHARARGAGTRPPKPVQPEDLQLEDLVGTADKRPEQVEALLEALERMQTRHPEWAKLVEHRYYLGYSAEEAGRFVGMPERTARREWERARLWLHKEVSRILNQ
jgi:RNA polymerase sigma factor (TIGR02999 family)